MECYSDSDSNFSSPERHDSAESDSSIYRTELFKLKRKWGLLATAEFLLLFRALTIFGAGALIEGRVTYWGFVLLAGKGQDGDRQRNQQPDESNEDFVQSVKLQAEFCGFGAFKDVAIMDRVLAGLLDRNLKENLLKEDDEALLFGWLALVLSRASTLLTGKLVGMAALVSPRAAILLAGMPLAGFSALVPPRALVLMAETLGGAAIDFRSSIDFLRDPAEI
ncbi:conserved hypothetical protein [Culex quinquefasciatus]|uniref:Uncharacterized protein n=1 Tax=Culex quinquefasciatus TaxID=7176 RepID=B0WQ27_CULQU|nr:conserved hypothetical protein [Culex quinquefasciatus]|eukprot:XP_001850811.1 conserved hypothetical protein [Culex quinquefasciatus]